MPCFALHGSEGYMMMRLCYFSVAHILNVMLTHGNKLLIRILTSVQIENIVKYLNNVCYFHSKKLTLNEHIKIEIREKQAEWKCV
jgi:hypothetical protein